MKINIKQFEKDFNTDTLKLSNKDLLKKYGFNSIKDMCEFAKQNIKIEVKEFTQEEKENLKGISNFLNNELKEVFGE